MKHGGDLGEARRLYGAGPPTWLDLSTGINPHPWPVSLGLAETGLRRLPSEEAAQQLLDAAREAYGVPPGTAIVAAPGTQALIQWLPRLAPPGRVAILGPTYAEHALAWRASGRRVVACGAPELPAEARHLVLVNPNNPDGRVVPAADLLGLADRVAARGGWLVVDESFADLDPAESLAGRIEARPIVVLRSFGKTYGLAGLRLGFAIAPEPIGAALRQALGPWAVSGPALAIGAAALADRSWLEAMRGRLAAESAQLDEVLRQAGLDVLGGTSLFRLAKAVGADRLHATLAERHIWCRRFAWSDGLLRFGLPPDADGLARLAEALSAWEAE